MTATTTNNENTNVVELSEWRPHAVIDIICHCCKYEWNDVAPVGEFEIKCPKCESRKTSRKKWLARGDYEYRCHKCRDTLFSFCEHGIYCINCGEYQDPVEIGHFSIND